MFFDVDILKTYFASFYARSYYVYIFLLQPVKAKSAKPLNNRNWPIGRGQGSIKVNFKKAKQNASGPKKLPSLSKKYIQNCDTNKTVLSKKPTKVSKGFINEYIVIFLITVLLFIVLTISIRSHCTHNKERGFDYTRIDFN